MDHHQFDEKLLARATVAILRTRDGLLRAAVPSPIGSCTSPNDVSEEEMNLALRRHKEIMARYPQNGEGIDTYVDASDTGYTENEKMEEEKLVEAAAAKAGKTHGMNGVYGVNEKFSGYSNGVTNGHTNGKLDGMAKKNGIKVQA
jgi:3-dehydroquinate synthase